MLVPELLVPVLLVPLLVELRPQQMRSRCLPGSALVLLVPMGLLAPEQRELLELPVPPVRLRRA